MSRPPDLAPWPGLAVVGAASGGARTSVWRARLDGRLVVVRRSRRSIDSLDWELDLLEHLAANEFVVPRVVPTEDGRRQVAGVVVQEWLDGRQPSSEADWIAVADELRRLHSLTADHRQRPGCCRVFELGPVRRSVDADLDRLPAAVLDRLLPIFAAVDQVGVAVVHGDPGPGNVRIDTRGRVGLLDWDESRVDVVWHDLSNLGVVVLPAEDHARATRLSHAWEAINGWVVEPAYARRRLAEVWS